MNLTIATAAEIVKYGPVNDKYPTEHICNAIYSIECLLFEECFGHEFHETLLSKVTDFSGAEDYEDKIYNLDEKVYYQGGVYQSLSANNNSLPNDSNSWIRVKKFNGVDDGKYQKLWELHLRHVIAFDVIYSTVRYSTNPAGMHGVTRQTKTEKGKISIRMLIDKMCFFISLPQENRETFTYFSSQNSIFSFHLHTCKAIKK